MLLENPYAWRKPSPAAKTSEFSRTAGLKPQTLNQGHASLEGLHLEVQGPQEGMFKNSWLTGFVLL